MTLYIDYNDQQRYATISPYDEKDEWHWNVITSTLYDKTVGLSQVRDTLFIPINRFIEIRSLLAKYAVNHNIKIKLSEAIRVFLNTANEQSYATAINKQAYTPEYIQDTLIKAGFKRKLTNNQLNNLCSKIK